MLRDSQPQMLHGTLWNENAELVKCCLEHPFVRRLAAGTLDREAFRRYVAQDAFFLRAFLKAYALAAAKCDDFERARIFHELMAGALDELKLHADYSAKLDIDLDHVTPYVATSAYTDFLLRVAWHGSLAEVMAAMVPCMRLYVHIGNELTTSLRPQHPYEDWIKTYSGDEFRQVCTRLESLLDEVAVGCPAVRDAYCYAMQCELDFFSAPLENHE
jgi:thiaminase/transcriptional activator TenA